jgi:sulfate transport system ATP-binding protein
MSVRVEGLCRRFTAEGSPAVDDVSFEAPEGVITTLLGPSGAGKTTVLRLIAGLERPDSGKVVIGDLNCEGLPVQKRGVGFVFQNYALFQHMTVRENIGFGLSVRKTASGELRERVSELLKLVQLEGLGNRVPAELSAGQRQRVAFARALAIQPRVLLMDEPFGALDARVRHELREWLQRLHAETRVTTLFVTHDQAEAIEVSQHVILMARGRVVQTGAPRDIYDHPATPFVAGFVGGSNQLQGTVRNGHVELGPLVVPAPVAARPGEQVQVFVRPHDISLTRPTDGFASELLGEVLRIQRVGGQGKVLVSLPGGAQLVVEMTRAELDSLGLAAGERVMVIVRLARFFAGEQPL